MKLLFDQNISYRIKKKLPSYIESVHISDVGLYGASDSEMWSFAKKTNCAIVTFDSDFYELSLFDGPPPKVIWLRTGNLTTNGVTKIILKNNSIIQEFCTSDKHINSTCLELGEN